MSAIGIEAKNLKVEIAGHLAWVTLDRPPANTLTIEFMDELIAVHRALEADRDIFGVCIRAARGAEYFSNGIDPAYLLERDVDGRATVFAKLVEMLGVLYGFSKPMAALIDGHAMAGGAVIGIVCDFRFMAEGRGRYAFSEVAVGLMIPDFLLEIIRGVVGSQHMVRVAQLATAYKPREALAIGLVDAVVPAAKLEEHATRHMDRILKMPLASMRAVKTQLRKALLDRIPRTADLVRAETFRELLGSYNFEEGLRSVVENRRPRFQNP